MFSRNVENSMENFNTLNRLDRLQVEVAHFLRDLASLAVADRAAVDLRDSGDAAQRAGHEGLVGGIDLRQGEVAFLRDVPGVAPGVEHVALGDALEAVEAGRGPDLAAADDEEVGRIAR